MRRPIDRDRMRISRPPPRARFDDRADGQEKPESKLTKREESMLGRGLLRAARAGMVSEVKRLVSEGANIDWSGQDGRTALMEAASGGHYEIVEFLIKNEASIWITDRDDNTALALALKKKHWGVVSLLERVEGYNPYD